MCINCMYLLRSNCFFVSQYVAKVRKNYFSFFILELFFLFGLQLFLMFIHLLALSLHYEYEKAAIPPSFIAAHGLW